MTPADSKDWWLAAAALSSVVSSTALATDAPQAGVVTAASASTRGGANGTNVVLGDHVHPGERFVTGPQGLTHILFLDQSSVTLGPNTTLRLDSFNHDSAAKNGKIAMTLEQGIVRVVGGLNSKTNPTEIKTTHGMLSISGGITVAETDGQKTSGVFLFGIGMTVADVNNNTQTVTRAGFGTNFGSGQPPATPYRLPISELNSRLQRLEAPSGGNPSNQQPGGAPPGQLISTGNVPGGGNNPGDTLAGDRLKTSVDTNPSTRPDNITAANTNSDALRNLLTTKPSNQS